MQFSSASRQFISLTTRSLQQSVLEHFQSVLPLMSEIRFHTHTNNGQNHIFFCIEPLRFQRAEMNAKHSGIKHSPKTTPNLPYMDVLEL